MYNEAKKASNKRYLDQFRTVSVRVKLDELPAIQAKAEEAGLALSAYMLQAARGEINTDNDLLPPGVLAVAESAAELAGKDLRDWLRQAIEEQNARDASARELRRQYEILKGRG